MFQSIPVRRVEAAAIILLNVGVGAGAETPLPFRRAGGHAVVVPVLVNGRGPFEFLVDTGASSSLLQDALAAELGLGAIDRVVLVSLAEERAVPRARLTSLVLGPHTISDTEVLVSALPEIRRTDGRIRGVLGYGALAGIDFGLDHRRGCLRFGAEGKRGDRVSATVEEGRIVLTARTGAPGRRGLRLVLDSGLAFPILFRKRSGLPDVALTGAQAAAVTDGGAAFLPLARLPSLRLGRTTLVDLPVAILEGRAAEGRSEDGLLPTRLFDSVFFEAGGASVWIEAR